MVLPLATNASAQPTAAAVQPAAASSTVPWADCGDGFQCANVSVPLDYDRPNGAKISIAVNRLPASAPSQRIGSLFVNPGGPGGSGVDFARAAARAFPADVQAKFDIVGFDPRGIINSTPLLCYGSAEEADADLPAAVYPETRAEENLQREWDNRIAARCSQRGGAILDHMSTADVARDLDFLRRAVGDDKLTYLGLSYGTFIGQTYANMFPGKVRALMIDGVLDPIAFTTGRGNESAKLPITYRVNSHLGSQETFDEFLRLCDKAGAGCAFSGNAKKRFAKLYDQLKAKPLVSTDPETGETSTFTVNDMISTITGALYSSSIWPDLGAFLADVEAGVSASQLGARVASMRAATKSAAVGNAVATYDNYIESFAGVVCADSDNPNNFQAWRDAADKAAKKSYFGRLWTWSSSVCLPWPKSAKSDRYAGPWDKRTAAPVLVIGNYFDPATPYSGAQTAAKLLPNSRLLSYAGWGHTAFLSGNDCIDSKVATYLLTEQVPVKGTVCQPVQAPFAQGAAVSAKKASTAAPVVDGPARW